MSPLSTDPEEWILQADNDIKTAEHQLSGNARFYAIFFCHLAVEKALKGLYFKKLNSAPPKTHNLLYLLKKIDIETSQEIREFLGNLQEAHITTRYPEEYASLQKEFYPERVEKTIKDAKDAIKWIKEKL